MIDYLLKACITRKDFISSSVSSSWLLHVVLLFSPYSSFLANLPLTRGLLSAKVFRHAYCNSKFLTSSVIIIKQQLNLSKHTLIFLLKFLSFLFFMYLWIFSLRSSVVSLLATLNVSVSKLVISEANCVAQLPLPFTR